MSVPFGEGTDLDRLGFSSSALRSLIRSYMTSMRGILFVGPQASVPEAVSPGMCCFGAVRRWAPTAGGCSTEVSWPVITSRCLSVDAFLRVDHDGANNFVCLRLDCLGTGGVLLVTYMCGPWGVLAAQLFFDEFR